VRLPAAISAATTITAVAVPASATAATATAAAPSPSAATTAEAATAAPASTASTALARGPSLVHYNIATHEIVAIQSLYGAFGFLVAIDLHKSEAAWLP
jgi:hypothetical protein